MTDLEPPMTGLELDPLIVATDRRVAEEAGHTLAEVVEEVVGHATVLYREKDLPFDERAALGREIVDAGGADLLLLVASDFALAAELDARGVHLAADDPPSLTIDGLMVGRSCHDAAEVSAAHDEGVDYVSLSPVFPSISKPEHDQALEPPGLRFLSAGHPGLAVYALGGVTADNAGECVRCGAAGVISVGSVMGAEDPGQVVSDIRHAIATAEDST
jgi:thiamine-phosphate pyrophosphorylase